jgi:exosortase/archaeosortase family protein
MANGTAIGLIDACIAGSAFYLLLILNLSTPKIKIKQRIFILLFDYFIFLVLNILRIFLLSILLINSSQIFYIVHLVFWYVISVILVLLIWIITVKLFKIKEAPFFSDIKELILYLKNSSS